MYIMYGVCTYIYYNKEIGLRGVIESLQEMFNQEIFIIYLVR